MFLQMTTAREIADWHRAEAQRLKAVEVHEELVTYRASEGPQTYATCQPAFDLTDRIKLHERFAAWLEKV